MSATFELLGQEFMALNGGPQFKFTEAISFFVSCKTQEEVDELWDKLSAGGQIRKMRLPERQVRPVVADCSHGFSRDVE
jgi:predicted 3-demethylubiquinone-9 3-methyltransferase (glyoxalase superfamily)